jgi:uncharacterized protein
MTHRNLRVPSSARVIDAGDKPFRVLSLTGGGYRGLFSSATLVHLADSAGRKGDPLHRCFDVIGGTSIGGLMACALAVGIVPRRVLDAIDSHGPRIFAKRPLDSLSRLFIGPPYDSKRLATAIDECLGAHAHRKLSSVDVGLVVPAVDWQCGQVKLFLSGAFGKAFASEATLREVCLATSAAPTYFKPSEVAGAEMLDGGLFANNPDTVILLEIARRWPGAIGRVNMLSIGTAGALAARKNGAAPKSKLGWAREMPFFMMDVQERTAAAQAARMLGKKRYLRVNHEPSRGSKAFDELDVANDVARTVLLDAAEATAHAAYKAHRSTVDRLLAGEV